MELFNWVGLTLASLIAIFYLSRIAAFILVTIVRLHVKELAGLESISVALLRGRIYFRNLHLVSSEMSIKIHRGYFQFSYWKRAPFKLRADGVSCYFFTNTAAYEKIESLIEDTVVPVRKHFTAFDLEVFGSNGTIIAGNPELSHCVQLIYDRVSGNLSSNWCFSSNFENIKVAIRPNVDFKENYLLYTRNQAHQPLSPFNLFRKRNLRTEDIPLADSHQWEGLARYRTPSGFDTNFPEIQCAQHEYILESPNLFLKYSNYEAEIIYDMQLKAAKITYGPWAHEQVSKIQKHFFPSLRRDLPPNIEESDSSLKVRVEFTELVRFDIQFKELSDNFKLGSINPNLLNQTKQTCGWVRFNASGTSFASLEIPILSQGGYFKSKCSIFLGHLDIVSSVNQEQLMKSSSLKAIPV